MATKNMAYDHPQYTVQVPIGGRLTGASGSFKFAAFTAMMAKSFTVAMRTVGTSATDVVTALKISGTATSTQIVGTFVGTTLSSTNVVGTLTLAQGDTLELTKGADATMDYSVAVECALTAGANVTV